MRLTAAGVFAGLAQGWVLGRALHLWRAWRIARPIAAADLFDPGWYARHGDVSGARLRLALHYVLRGAAEGRSPSAAFDGAAYLRRYPAVALAGTNPLADYLRHHRTADLEIAPAAAAALPRLPPTRANLVRWQQALDAAVAPAIARLRAAEPVLPLLALPGDGQDAAHVLLCPAGVGLAATAVLELRAALRRDPAADLIFADETGRHAGALPWFKPGWDPDLFAAGDLTGPATVFSRALLARLGWDGTLPDAPGLRALALRAAALPCHIVHVPRPLFVREGRPALMPVKRDLPVPAPLVSVIIPTRDRAGLLEEAAAGVLRDTAYSPLELLILDNGSTGRATRALFAELAQDKRVRILPAPGPFNWSALNNRAAREARGTVLVFLNNDVEMPEPGWLAALVAQAMRPEVGPVGARLLYPGGRLQHAGIGLDEAGLACHPYRRARAEAPGLAGELLVARASFAVTGACLAVRRDAFWALGGFEETHLAVTHNDIDFCLRARDAGLRVIVEPRATLLHREAATRGPDRAPAAVARAAQELAYLRKRWGDLAGTDPLQNPHLCWLRDRPALRPPLEVAALLKW